LTDYKIIHRNRLLLDLRVERESFDAGCKFFRAVFVRDLGPAIDILIESRGVSGAGARSAVECNYQPRVRIVSVICRPELARLANSASA
jgi:hypothetical protein